VPFIAKVLINDSKLRPVRLVKETSMSLEKKMYTADQHFLKQTLNVSFYKIFSTPWQFKASIWKRLKNIRK
jgi:hypothetical protein